MENNSETVKEDLKVLKLQDKEIENLSISEVIRAYRKLARFVHPDTSGYESTADFPNRRQMIIMKRKHLMMKRSSLETTSTISTFLLTKMVILL